MSNWFSSWLRAVVTCMFFVLVSCLAGCGFGTDYIKVNRYQPIACEGKPGQGVNVHVVRAVDYRTRANQVGTKAHGDVALEKGLELTDIVTDSVVTCLEDCGYSVTTVEFTGKSGKFLKVSIDDFWTYFVHGFWTVDAIANVKLRFEVVDKGVSKVFWQRTVASTAKNSAPSALPGLFEDSLNEALTISMLEFQYSVSRSDFVDAVKAED